MTDLQVIEYIVEQSKADQKFTGRNDAEYKAYLKGQEVGVTRAMAFLRNKCILKPITKNRLVTYVF